MNTILNIAITSFLALGGVGVDTTALEGAFRLSVNEEKVEIQDVRLTGYNAVPEQTDSEPHITASGAYSNPDVVIARSRDLAETLPFGTVVELHSPQNAKSCGFEKVESFIGYRVVADTMHKRKTKQLDVMFHTGDAIKLGKRFVNPATAMGICNVDVRVVGHVAISEIPKTQTELAFLVNGFTQLGMK